MRKKVNEAEKFGAKALSKLPFNGHHESSGVVKGSISKQKKRQSIKPA
jgi:hypothetical protein